MKMKSEWRVTANSVGGEMLYGVYRLRDKDALDHSGNRESLGRLFDDRKLAEDMARIMNEEETEK